MADWSILKPEFTVYCTLYYIKVGNKSNTKWLQELADVMTYYNSTSKSNLVTKCFFMYLGVNIDIYKSNVVTEYACEQNHEQS